MARQLVTESLVLAVAGGVLGIAAGYAGMRLMTAQVAEQLPRATEIGLHATTLAVTAGLALFAGVFFGTIPVVGLFRADLSTVFRQEGRTGTSSRRALAARGVLVATQVSLAFALLIAAGLLLASFGRKLSVRTGFAPEAVVTASVSLPVSRYGDGEARRTFVARTLEGIRALPGISAAGVTNAIPFGADFNSSVMTPEGYVPRPGESPLSPAVSSISPGYFEAMGIPIVRGRPFDARDANGAPLVVIVDEWLAQRYWPGQDPIGKRLYQGVPEMGETPVWRTIVGVAKEIRFMSLAGDEQVGHYYYPYDQAPTSGMFLTVRTSGDPLAMVGAVRSEVTAIDPDLPVYGVETMLDRIADSMLPDRVRMTLTLVFAGVALLLAAVGIYGVLAYMVAQRAREIGIRMALGSGRQSVFRLVLGQGLRLLGIGLALGIVASLAIGRVLRGMLYGITPADPLVFAGVLAVLGSVAVAACVVPAVRACRIAPATALGTE
jgi:predicted permease